MMYLLDTHIFLWWLNNDRKLSDTTKNLITDPKNTIYVSIVSAWEISIKVRAKKLPLKTRFTKIFENFQFKLFNVNVEHILMLHKLPLHHKDPFDRMLIAQAKVEDCTLVTVDQKIQKYKIPILSS